MKKLIVLGLAVLSLNSYALFSPISNADYDATVEKARSVAEMTATGVAQDRGEGLTSLIETRSRGLTAVYEASTDSGCQFDVKVGLFFRAKTSNFVNCQ